MDDYGKDKAKIPDTMDKNLIKYDAGDNIEGSFSFSVDRKDKSNISLCITSLSCKPQIRVTGKEDY